MGKPPSKAEATSLWYILINKKQKLIQLYEQEKATGGGPIAGLLSQDFTTEKARKVANKNAFAVRQKANTKCVPRYSFSVVIFKVLYL